MDKFALKNLLTSYASWLANPLKRRRFIMLGLIGCILLFVLCLQHNTSDGTENSNGLLMSNFEQAELPRAAAVSSVVRKINDDVQFVEEQPAQIRIQQPQINVVSQQFQPYVPSHRLIHLDLKGAPPKILYLQKLFPLIKKMGGTGLLIEWEDMFPWSGELSEIAAGNAYTRAEVKEILRLAKLNNLDVIPLIQTFGHVEFALKTPDFTHLREVPESPQALCPSYNASIKFVEQIIDQVMELHGNIKYLHIGCDEVFQIGECFRCKSIAKEDLFLSHVVKVATYVRTRYPSTIPIIWDDMLRHLSVNSMQMYNIGKLVEPMIWVYAEDVYRFVMQTVWEKYQAVFPHAWTSSAFKGAFGETLYVPNVKRHLENNLNWLQLMSNEESRFTGGFKGIVITGWQRYDHFAVLCETLPASIPSMIVNLMAVSHGYMNQSLQAKLNDGLSCGIFGSSNEYDEDFLSLKIDPYLWEQFSRCSFPGYQFFRLTYRLHLIEGEYNKFIDVTKKKRGWMTNYNVEREFSTPIRVDELMEEYAHIYRPLLSLVKPIQESLTGIFDKFTISEWIEQKIYPMVKELEKIQKEAHDLKLKKTWPKRPLPVLKELARIGFSDHDSPTITLDKIR
ncbi:hexosaminidase D-like isoform X4 [Daktulosphaira vitifoliae]|uniref:hexosaminidase D-like isoform X4 n=1 Tax=Daktulosphaira vitifoliae TaxID=58002 RepID=UPI0021AA1728|nr:hexosaminidase D-like isoform X4 [Daktulosphaira vitifoliae]